MSYIPPSSQNIDFSLTSGYTPPGSSEINFVLGQESTGALLDSIVTGSPAIQAVEVYITFGIVDPVGITTGAPLVQVVTATNPACKPLSVITGAPAVPEITAESLAGKPLSVVTGAPVVSFVNVSSPYGIAVPDDLVTVAPDIAALDVRLIVAFPNDIVTGSPVVPMVTTHVPGVSVDGVTAGAPVVPVVTAQYVSARIEDVITGAPVVPVVTATSDSVGVDDIFTGVPAIDSLTAWLTYAVAYPADVITGVPDVQEALAYKNLYSYAAKSVIFDFADNWSGDLSDKLGIRSIDFYYRGELISLAEANFVSYAYIVEGGSYAAYRAFVTSYPKDGSARYNSWRTYTGYIINQRLIVVFNSNNVKFDQIAINNYHDSGADTDFGVRNTKIYTSSDTVLNMVYEEDINTYRLIYDGEIAQHVAADQEDTELLVLDQPSMAVTAGNPVIAAVFAYLSCLPDDVITNSPIVDNLTCFSLTHIDNLISGSPAIGILDTFFVHDESGSFDLEIPISFSMSTGSDLSETLPGLSLDASLYAGRIGDIEITMPFMDLCVYSGDTMELTLPAFIMSSVMAQEELIDIVCRFSSLGMSMNGIFDSNGSLNCIFPALKMEADLLTGNTIDILGGLPGIQMINSLLTGAMIDVDGTIPGLESRIQSIITGDNDMAAMMSAFALVCESGSINDEIMRYVKGKMR